MNVASNRITSERRKRIRWEHGVGKESERSEDERKSTTSQRPSIRLRPETWRVPLFAWVVGPGSCSAHYYTLTFSQFPAQGLEGVTDSRLTQPEMFLSPYGPVPQKVGYQ